MICGLGLMVLLSACSSAGQQTQTASPSRLYPTTDAGWPPFPARSDAPAGIVLTANGASVTFANRGSTALWWSGAIDLWTGPPWKRTNQDVAAGDAVEVDPGATIDWAFDPRTRPVRVALRLWPSSDPSGIPYVVWNDVQPGASPGSAEVESLWKLGIANGTTLAVSLVVNGEP